MAPPTLAPPTWADAGTLISAPTRKGRIRTAFQSRRIVPERCHFESIKTSTIGNTSGEPRVVGFDEQNDAGEDYASARGVSRKRPTHVKRPKPKHCGLRSRICPWSKARRDGMHAAIAAPPRFMLWSATMAWPINRVLRDTR